MSHSLADLPIEAASRETLPLAEDALTKLRHEIAEWTVVTVGGVQRLRRLFEFPDFARALEFTSALGALAEHESHHPEIVTSHVEQPSAIGWGRVSVTWATMIIEALHRNDFVMAAKTDRLYADVADQWQ
jgi:4a-hydroxytetrahydrobiopterin dehydratase